MALSEHEERILAEIERQLAEEDPRFARRSRRSTGGAVARLRLAVALGVVGVVLIALLTFDALLGALGFALLLAAVPLGVRAAAARARELARPVPPDERPGERPGRRR